MSFIKEVELGGKTVRFEFEKYAKQANGSVMVSCGETQVLVTVCAATEPREGADFFPLTVDYIEKFYAAGRIPGGFIKREGKVSDREALVARVIDRPLRPSFPKEYLCDTHVIATVLSVDQINHPAPLALMGASAALMMSDIPFNGPVAALRVGRKDGEFYIDPPEDSSNSEIDLNIAANPDAVLMVEASAKFVSEELMLDAINFAHEQMKPIFELQLEVQREIGRAKMTLPEKAENPYYAKLMENAGGLILETFGIREKQARSKALKALGKKLQKEMTQDGNEADAPLVGEAYNQVLYDTMRNMILDDKKRIDGRAFNEIRHIACETKILKRAHGSSLFTRGETQALGCITLGSAEDEQKLDTILTPGAAKRFLLHYNFPPYSVGEARFLKAPGRREIGHGSLAEKALLPIIPDSDKFDYTIRLVSEVLESNGSSSMATVCAGTMALLDAGVPIKQPVAGIAMGLVMEGDRHAVLSDILGDEDHLGDMDFKVTGGREGITALQMDIKISGLPKEIMVQALMQAKEGRNHILEIMSQAIDSPSDLSAYAPRVFQMKIKQDKIRDLIGPGGKTIKQIVNDCGVKIDISDEGFVNVIAPTRETAENAKRVIRNITSDPEIGAIYLGRVKRVMDFGAFVEIRPGLEGLLHISQLAEGHVAATSDVIKENEDVLVKVVDVDKQGKIKLSRKEALGKKPSGF